MIQFCRRSNRAHPLVWREGKRDCLQCHREREAARKRALGVKPLTRQAACKRGHDLTVPGNRRPGRSDCAICHRERQKARYHDDPERHRKASLEYQKANREAVNARIRRWRAAQPEAERLRTMIRRGRRGEVLEAYAVVLLGDPCSYCGSPKVELDHIDSVGRGGSNAWDNLTAACRSCNASKNARPLLAFLLAA